MSPAEIEAMKEEVRASLAQVHQLAERHCFRENTDFIGRMTMAISEIEDVDAEAPGGVYSDDEREVLDEALLELAGLCLGRLALLRRSIKTPA